MLNHLTKYLLQYRTVSIPHVGTIQIVQHPSQLNVVDKLILPPSYFVELGKGEEVSDHQLTFLDRILNRGKDDILKDLFFFGDKLQEKINGPGFEWAGLGTITRSTQSIPLSIEALVPVPAERVLPQDARHSVLVGDHQMTSGQSTEVRTETYVKENKRSIFIITGWVLLLLSILFIVFYLYTRKFKLNATGSQQSPTGNVVNQPEMANS